MKWIEDRKGGIWNLSTVSSIQIRYDSIYACFGENEFPILKFDWKEKWCSQNPKTDKEISDHLEIDLYNAKYSSYIQIIGKALVEFIKDEEAHFFSIREIIQHMGKNPTEEESNEMDTP